MSSVPLSQIESLRFALDNVPAYVYIKDKDLRYVYANKHTLQLFGCSADDLIGKADSDFFPQDTVLKLREIDLRVLNGEKTEQEIVSFDSDGDKRVYWEVKTAMLESKSSNNAVGILGISTDITNDRFRLMFDSMSEGFCVIEMLFDEQGRPKDYRFIEVNPVFESQSGLENAKGKRMREFAPNHEEYWFEIFGKVAITGEPVEFQNEAKALSRWFEVKAYRVGGKDSRKLGVLFKDITKQKENDRVLELSEKRFRTIYENAPVLIDAFDENGRCVLWNKECQKTFGWTMEEVNASENPLEMFYPDPAVRAAVLLTVTTEPDGQFREWSARTKDGRALTTVWANFRLPDGMTFSMGLDITAQKQAEKSISNSLEEKETLLKEIHHRVKNNLQIVSSLLSLQKARETDQHTTEILSESERRIKVMAQLHETLHKSNNLSSINISDYLNSVALDSIKILEGQELKITYTCDVEEIRLDISQSMALGQILSELLSNSAKHAFVGREAGYIRIELQRIKDKVIEFRVIDDGAGFPDNFNINELSTLGYKLTRALVQQLDGTLLIENSPG
ncbi:MAG: PAS domain S-box protein, partial [Betaproteobacteria bacterium]|nr:PAS domain S-box protein [Betaproteobacteria bacterium]